MVFIHFFVVFFFLPELRYACCIIASAAVFIPFAFQTPEKLHFLKIDMQKGKKAECNMLSLPPPKSKNPTKKLVGWGVGGEERNKTGTVQMQNLLKI